MGNDEVGTVVSAVIASWNEAAHCGLLSPQTATKFTSVASRFASFTAALDIVSIHDVDVHHCRAFIQAYGKDRAGERVRPALSTMHNRRATIRALYATARRLGLVCSDPTIDITLPDRDRHGSVRPLTEEEADQVRFFADQGPTTRHMLTTTLLLAGARTAEVGWISVADFDLDQGSVRVHGAAKYDTRTLQLRQEDLSWVRDRITHLHDDHNALVCGPVTGAAANRQSTIGMTVGTILKAAGLTSDPTITPTSLTAYAGLRAFERTGRIEETARVTGCRSLDAAATLIGHHWRNHL